MKVEADELDSAVREKIHEFLVQVGNDLLTEIKKETPVDTGRLRQSWQMQPPKQGELEVVLGTNVDYVDDVEEGAPPHTPHWESIKKWTRRKLGGGEPTAGAVFQKIKQEGTEGQRPVGKAIENLQGRY